MRKSPSSFRAVPIFDAHDIWAISSDGIVIHYDGQLWSEVHRDANLGGAILWASGPSDLWLASPNKVTRFDGRVWTDVLAPGRITALFGRSSQDVVAIGDGAGNAAQSFFHFDGSAWSAETVLPTPSHEDIDWFGIGGSTTDGYWVVGSDGAIAFRP